MDKYYDHLEHQDWKTIKVDNKKKVVVNIENKKKVDPNINNIKKLDKKVDDDDLKHKKISIEMRQNIIKGRTAMGLTQKELAQRCNFNVQIVNDIETGKAIYNHIHINKIKRVLKMK